jgi:SAM-dependent methyltransferase
MQDDVVAHYAAGRERDRLTRGAGRLEALRTMELLRRWLPRAPAVVLDVGGGPGRYALELARAGYDVSLIDPVPLHVSQARADSAAAQRPLVSAGEVAGAGLVPYGPVAVEGLGWLAPDVDALLDEPLLRDRVLDAIRRTEREPALLGASAHLLVAGRKA